MGSGREIVIGSALLLGNMGMSAAAGFLTVSETAGGFAVVFSVGTLGAALRYRAKARMRELDQVKLLGLTSSERGA